MDAPLEVCVAGAEVIGPGYPGWAASCAILAGESVWQLQPMPAPEPALLPPTERRRCPARVRLALAVAQAALAPSGLPADAVATVFASSDDDGELASGIYESLAQQPPSVSPTRFQNSVHNASAGYWSIATGSRQASTSISAFDWTFAAALLEAVTQVVVDARSVLMVAYDLPFPQPLHALRPMSCGIAIGMVLRPVNDTRAFGRLRLNIDAEPRAAVSSQHVPEPLRATPAAWGLALLAAIANPRHGPQRVPYLDNRSLVVEID